MRWSLVSVRKLFKISFLLRYPHIPWKPATTNSRLFKVMIPHTIYMYIPSGENFPFSWRDIVVGGTGNLNSSIRKDSLKEKKKIILHRGRLTEWCKLVLVYSVDLFLYQLLMDLIESKLKIQHYYWYIHAECIENNTVMPFSIVYSVSARDTNISLRPKVPRADIGQGLILVEGWCWSRADTECDMENGIYMINSECFFFDVIRFITHRAAPTDLIPVSCIGAVW